jgi:hypothetical protein
MKLKKHLKIAQEKQIAIKKIKIKLIQIQNEGTYIFWKGWHIFWGNDIKNRGKEKKNPSKSNCCSAIHMHLPLGI